MRQNQLTPRAGEQVIITDKDHQILYSDFEPFESTVSIPKLHLLDIVSSSKEQDVLRVVGVALDRVDQQIEADLVFRSRHYHVRAVYSESDKSGPRTHIFFKEGTPPVQG